MAKLIDLDFINYQETYNNFNNIYDEFSKKNVTKKNLLLNEVYHKEPDDIYRVAIKTIHLAIIVYDEMLKLGNSVDSNNRSFISGIKLIDNYIKHKNGDMDIQEFLDSAIKQEVSILNVLKIPSPILTSKLVVLWKDIDNIIEKEIRTMTNSSQINTTRTQLKNYNRFIRGNEFEPILSNLDLMICKLYSDYTNNI